MKNIISLIISLAFVAILSVGKIYDERLNVFGVNISYLIVTCFLMGILLYISKADKIKVNDSLFLFLCFSGIVYLSYFLVVFDFFDFSNLEYATNKIVVYGLITVPISLVLITNQHESLLKFILYSFLFVAGLLALTGWVSLITNGSVDRLSVFGGGPIVYARWVFSGAIISIFYLKRRKFKVLLSFFFVVPGFFSYSKGPLLFFIITVVLVYFILNKKSKYYYLGLAVIAIGLFYFSFLNDNVINYSNLFGRYSGLLTADNITELTSVSSRLSLINTGFEIFLSDPLGIGLGNWIEAGRLYGNGLSFFYPHNLLIEIGNELGIISLILFIFYYIKSFKNVYRSFSKFKVFNNLSLVIIALTIFYTLNSLVSGDLSDARFLFIFLAMGCSIGNLGIEKIDKQNQYQTI